MSFCDWDELTPATAQRMFWFLARLRFDRALEVFRVSGSALCKWCKRPYDQHPKPEPDVIPTLHVDCEGRRVKT